MNNALTKDKLIWAQQVESPMKDYEDMSLVNQFFVPKDIELAAQTLREKLILDNNILAEVSALEHGKIPLALVLKRIDEFLLGWKGGKQ